MMRLYYHHDGSYTVSREVRRTREGSLEYEAVRIVEVRDDGSIHIVKDRYDARGNRQLLTPLPLSKVHCDG